ncbi:MAG: glycogen-binding domain-containing protein [Thermodesulfobacteriota bacterium]
MGRNDLPSQKNAPEKDELDEKDLQIIRWIGEMRDREPPSRLLSSVMEAIQPKRLIWWRRMCLWAQTPKTIHLTPLKLAPVAAVLFVAILLSGLLFIRQQKVPYLQSSEERLIPVVFRLNLSGAQSVSVVGSFNAWKPQGYEMQPDRKSGWWTLTVSLPDGRYEYMFLVDGQKMIQDPEALIHQEDGFGNQNSVLVLRRENGETT